MFKLIGKPKCITRIILKQTVYSQSISTHPGVRANILTKAGVSDKFLRTKHPRLSMDLLVWKFFIATTVRRAIWYM